VKLPRFSCLLITMLFVGLWSWVAPVLAQDFTIEATVDRREVGFGEALSLSVTITQTGSGFGERVQVPQIDSIPGFDIVGRRSAQNMTLIQGVGRTQVQILLELVPQSPGDKVIPALSLTTSTGKVSSTHPIPIKVLPPPAPGSGDAGQDSDAAVADPARNDPQGMGFLKGFLWIALFLVLTLAAPVLLSYILDRRRRRTSGAGEPSSGMAGLKREFPPGGPATGSSRRGEVSDAEIVPDSTTSRVSAGTSVPGSGLSPRPRLLDFAAAIEDLKRQNPEADLGFFRSYFDLFRQAYQAKHKRVLDRMTPSEIVQATGWTLGADGAGRFKRLIDDWEMTAFANTRPSRPFGSVHEDALAILQSIPPQERRP
jgi:hypothetical protein